MYPLRLVQQARRLSQMSFESKTKNPLIEHNSQIMLPKALDDLAVHINDHIRKDFSEQNLTTKVKVLEEIGFSEYMHNSSNYFTFKTPRICFADFGGKKELFLRRAGLWEAYKNLCGTEKKHLTKSTSIKVLSPLRTSLNTERKTLLKKSKTKGFIGKAQGVFQSKVSQNNCGLEDAMHITPVNSKKRNIETQTSTVRPIHAQRRGSHLII
ncbi:hypothetical protein SteCoe_12902 [Stentor coeruleus]|uniref:Uncharacterized protein n=1 Tax=Stentor coeruleus TaxID=5963 RepID=A0A1R2C9M7_9CILI|nr:hypothetical protein SteCoe_12902 [Stentor coeruleus]